MAVAGGQRISKTTLSAIAVMALIFFVVVIRPFLEPVVFAAFVAVVAWPAQEWLVAHLRGRPRLAAALVAIGALLLIVVPLVTLVVLGVRELVEVVGEARERLDRLGVLRGAPHGTPAGRLAEKLQLGAAEIQRLALAALQRAATWATGLFAATSALVAHGFLMLVGVYYLLVDGRRLLAQIVRLVPMEERYERELFRGMADATRAIVLGNLGAALLQGALGGLGFLIFGVGAPVLWGLAMAVASLVPVVGTALIWAPAAGFLALEGRGWNAIGLASWGVVVISSLDNIVRPLLVRGRMRMHPFLAFLAVFGGVSFFGLSGIFLGPLVAAFFLVVARMYQREVAEKTGDT